VEIVRKRAEESGRSKEGSERQTKTKKSENKSETRANKDW
jgi:hypothetical protein